MKRVAILLLFNLFVFGGLAQGPSMDLLSDFKSRLQTAIQSRNTFALSALYQTNRVNSEVLNFELARWEQMVRADAATVSLFFKELRKLPPEAHRYWSTRAQRLTTNSVTHFAIIHSRGGSQLIVPLVQVEGRLWIVPSERLGDKNANRGDASKKEVRWHYTSLSHWDHINFEHDPEVLRLQRAGWTFLYIEESAPWVGGVDRPGGHYAIFGRKVPE